MKNFRRLLGYAKKYRFQILLALVCALVSSLGVVAATYLNGVAIDHIHGPGAVDFPGLIQILIGLGVIYVVSSLFQWFISRYANKVSYLVVRDMRRDTFHNLNLQPLSYYDNHPHGDIISRFTCLLYTSWFSGSVRSPLMIRTSRLGHWDWRLRCFSHNRSSPDNPR